MNCPACDLPVPRRDWLIIVGKPKAAEIERVVCRAWSRRCNRPIWPYQLAQRPRSRHLADARAVVWWLIYEQLGWSYPQVGRRYDRDHTSILAGVRRCREKILPGRSAGDVWAELQSLTGAQNSAFLEGARWLKSQPKTGA